VVARIEVMSSDAERARSRARTVRKRGDIAGARAALEAALEGAKDEISRAALAADLDELKKDSETLVTRDERAPADDAIVGRSPAMARLKQEIAKAAASSAPLLIEGGSGAGKELVAREVHALSPRRDEPFVAVSAAALASGIVEAELFGHAAGAFTGATAAREGLLAEAGAGTLLLDGVDEMPGDIQAKLLRVLEGGEVRPVGGGASVKLRARIIATSRRALGPLVRSGEMREDLLYRLAVLTISVPALRERAEDIPLLADHLLRRHAKDRRPPRLTAAALDALVKYPWPGNVRELENELRRLLVVGVDPVDVGALSPAIRRGEPASQKELSTGLYERIRGRTMDEIEKAAILAALRASDGNRSQAARILKVSRRALYDKMKRFGLG
jgi:DNA-binding NtrC family response regulator